MFTVATYYPGEDLVRIRYTDGTTEYITHAQLAIMRQKTHESQQ